MDMSTGEVIDGSTSSASKSECIDVDHKKKKGWWTLDSAYGCHINGLTPGQKYEAVIHVATGMDAEVKNIRVW